MVATTTTFPLLVLLCYTLPIFCLEEVSHTLPGFYTGFNLVLDWRPCLCHAPCYSSLGFCHTYLADAFCGSPIDCLQSLPTSVQPVPSPTHPTGHGFCYHHAVHYAWEDPCAHATFLGLVTVHVTCVPSCSPCALPFATTPMTCLCYSLYIVCPYHLQFCLPLGFPSYLPLPLFYSSFSFLYLWI